MNLIKSVFAFILILGGGGLYLILYGGFSFTLIGLLSALLVGVIITYLDVRLKLWTVNYLGKNALLLTILCLFFYCVFSGIFVLRAAHEVVGVESRVTVSSYLLHLRGNFSRLCRYRVVIVSPVEYSGRRVCISRDKYRNLHSDSVISPSDPSISILLKDKKSLLGSTISI